MYFSRLISKIKALCRSFKGTIWIFSIYFPILGYPAILEYVNAVPQREDLLWINGRVMSVQAESPHVTVRLADQSIGKLDVYENLAGMARGRPDLSEWQVNELSKFIACDAEMGVFDVNWSVISMPPRIWDLSCGEKRIAYEKFARDAQFTKSVMLWVTIFVHFIFIYMIVRAFLFERRKWRACKAPIVCD